MSVQQISSNPVLVPATISSGFSAGRTTQKILVDPTSDTYYCTDCAYTSRTFAGVRGHRSTHGVRKSRTTQVKPDLGARIDQVASLLAEVRAEFVDITDEKVDVSWKKRAQDAERRLSQLRRALGSGE